MCALLVRRRDLGDAVLLVLLDEEDDPTAIYKADRRVLLHALPALGSWSRNDRGQLRVSKFKSIGLRIGLT